MKINAKSPSGRISGVWMILKYSKMSFKMTTNKIEIGNVKDDLEPIAFRREIDHLREIAGNSGRFVRSEDAGRKKNFAINKPVKTSSSGRASRVMVIKRGML